MLSARKVIVLVLTLLTVLFLTSCTAETESYINDYDAHASGIEANDPIPLDIAHTSFTGDPDQAYNFLWQEGRDREWEEDIIFYAETILASHTFFVNFDTFHVEGEAGRLHYSIPSPVDYTGPVFDAILRRTATNNGILAYERNDIVNALRELFIDKINVLIEDIPNLYDFEIKYRLAEVSTLLGDIHTEIDLRDGNVFPVHVIVLYDGLYLASVPEEIAFALYSKVLAINDTCIFEIFELFRSIVPHENEYPMRGAIQQLLMIEELLYYLNIVDSSGTAHFTIMDTSGEVSDIQLQAISQYEFQNMSDAELVRHNFSRQFMHSRTGDRRCLITSRQLEDGIDGDFFWHEFFPCYNVLYVRSVHFRGTQDIIEAQVYLVEQLRDWPYGKIDKFVLDIRQNTGGVRDFPSIFQFHFLSQIASDFYVLIDGRSVSRSLTVAANMRNHMESNVTIVGEPAGQPENFLMAPRIRTMPNSGLMFSFATGLSVNSSSEETIFMPDIFIPLTIDDIINNHDPLLDFIKNR